MLQGEIDSYLQLYRMLNAQETNPEEQLTVEELEQLLNMLSEQLDDFGLDLDALGELNEFLLPNDEL